MLGGYGVRMDLDLGAAIDRDEECQFDSLLLGSLELVPLSSTFVFHLILLVSIYFTIRSSSLFFVVISSSGSQESHRQRSFVWHATARNLLHHHQQQSCTEGLRGEPYPHSRPACVRCDRPSLKQQTTLSYYLNGYKGLARYSTSQPNPTRYQDGVVGQSQWPRS